MNRGLSLDPHVLRCVSAMPDSGIPHSDLAGALAALATAVPGASLPPEALASFAAANEVRVEDFRRYPADTALACACALGNAAAMAAFDAQFSKIAANAIRRYSDDPLFRDDVLQTLRVQLLVGGNDKRAMISTYNAKGALAAWVSVCAIRLMLYSLRTQRNRKEDPLEWTDAITHVSTGSPELDAIAEQHREAFAHAVREACAALPRRLRSILRMHFVEGLALNKIAIAYAVNRTTVWRWIEQARDELQVAISAKLAQTAGIRQSDLPSLAALVRSQLDLGMSQLLATRSRMDAPTERTEPDTPAPSDSPA